MTENLLIKYPYSLEISIRIVDFEKRGSDFRLEPDVTIAEIKNPEGGDVGVIEWLGGKLIFNRVYMSPQKKIWHQGTLIGSVPSIGMVCKLYIDSKQRLKNSAYHTFSHLLTGLGLTMAKDVFLAKSEVFDTYGKLRLIGQAAILYDLSPVIWDTALGYINADHPVEIITIGREEGLSLIDPVYHSIIPASAETIRLVRIGYHLPWIPCGGVHLKNLNKIKNVTKPDNRSAFVDINDLIIQYSIETY